VVTHRGQIEEIPEVIARGVSSFKFFPGYVGEQARSLGMDESGFTPDLFFLACEVMRAVPGSPLPMVHAEEPYVRGLLTERAKALDGAPSLAAWAAATPDWAESAQVLTYAHVAAMHDLPLYVVHVSAAPTIDAIGYLKGRGLRIIGETLPSFLCATDEQLDRGGMGARAKVQPPIRGSTHQARLWDGIRHGELSVIGTDSVNYSTALKDKSPFWDVRPGANVQLADTLALLFNDAVLGQGIDLPQLSRLLAGNAARAFGMYPKKGAIRVGSDADLVVVDPGRDITLGVDRYQSGSGYSVWEGRKVRGMPIMTFLRGTLVMEEGRIVAPEPDGRLVPSDRTGSSVVS
jgi:dihydroorotase-like cyclic amidohydrolase